MTTIAYKDNIIAYDSRTTQGPVITDDETEKRIEKEDHIFFGTGYATDVERLIDLFLENAEYNKDLSYEAAIFVITPELELWQASVEPDEGFWKSKKRLDNVWAMGSGGDFALTAMDMGASAKEAVEMAAKRDTGTGGLVREYRVGHNSQSDNVERNLDRLKAMYPELFIDELFNSDCKEEPTNHCVKPANNTYCNDRLEKLGHPIVKKLRGVMIAESWIIDKISIQIGPPFDLLLDEQRIFCRLKHTGRDLFCDWRSSIYKTSLSDDEVIEDVIKGIKKRLSREENKCQ